MDCTTCHSMEPYVQSLEDSNLLAYTHVQEGLECEDCHEQEAIRQTHEEIVPGTRVRPLRVANEFCFDCHVDNEHTSYEQVIERTMDYTVDGQQINDPHANVRGCRNNTSAPGATRCTRVATHPGLLFLPPFAPWRAAQHVTNEQAVDAGQHVFHLAEGVIDQLT